MCNIVNDCNHGNKSRSQFGFGDKTEWLKDWGRARWLLLWIQSDEAWAAPCETGRQQEVFSIVCNKSNENIQKNRICLIYSCIIIFIVFQTYWGKRPYFFGIFSALPRRSNRLLWGKKSPKWLIGCEKFACVFFFPVAWPIDCFWSASCVTWFVLLTWFAPVTADKPLDGVFDQTDSKAWLDFKSLILILSFYPHQTKSLWIYTHLNQTYELICWLSLKGGGVNVSSLCVAPPAVTSELVHLSPVKLFWFHLFHFIKFSVEASWFSHEATDRTGSVHANGSISQYWLIYSPVQDIVQWQAELLCQ